MPRLAVIYYSSTGHVHKLAQAVVAGAEETGAEVRLRRVPELAPEEVVRSQDAWHEHAMSTRETVPEASMEDLQWADGYAFGTPTRGRRSHVPRDAQVCSRDARRASCAGSCD
jgi:NAD(P)H dehydrogenase (quinone)